MAGLVRAGTAAGLEAGVRPDGPDGQGGETANLPLDAKPGGG